MMAYREGPPAAGLPFPRKNLALFTALAIVLSALVFVLPLPLFATRRGLQLFREGGFGMLVLVAASLLAGAACAVAGAFAVRGHRTWAALVVAVPAVPALLAALLAVIGSSRLFGAVAGVEVEDRVRILAAGLGEVDALPAYGCFVAAIASGAAAVALLGGAASVDRKHHQAPAGAAWAAPLALGGFAFMVSVGLRVGYRTGFATLLLGVPSLAIVTTLACLAAVNAPLVRHWREPHEADAWTSSFLAAAVLAGGGFALLDLAAAFLSEGSTLSAISGGGPDSLQGAVMLASLAEEQHVHRVLAVVDGLFGFIVVAAAAVTGLGRGVDGRLRLPRGAPLLVAIGAGVLLVAAIAGTRAWELGRIAQLGGAGDGAKPEAPAGRSDGAGDGKAQDFDLPRVPRTARLSSSSSRGRALLRIDAEGRSKLRPAPVFTRSDVLVVEADRHATWGDVSRRIREVLQSTQADLGADRVTSIELRVTLLDKADRSQLGPYAALLGPETAALRIAIPTGGTGAHGQNRAADDEDDDDTNDDLRALRPAPLVARVRPRAHEIMDGVAASIAMRPTRLGGSSFPDVALMPPDGAW